METSKKIMLTNSQKKEILKSYKETDMHKELKILFEKIYLTDTSIYITHGKDEMGRDLIISQKTPMETENIAVVVKMDKLSGSASDKNVNEIIMQINQCFEVPKSVNDQLEPLKTDKVFVFIFGEISNKVQANLNGSLKLHEGKIKYFDIEKILDLFSRYYPNIFLGASGVEALHKKYNELENKLLTKNKLLKTSFIEPNLRKFKKSKKHLLSISKDSDTKKVGKTLSNSLFGEKETIESLSDKILKNKTKILIEGEAGSGKTIFSIKLAMYIIENEIKKINLQKNKIDKINVPIIIKATTFQKNSLNKIIENYYDDNTYILDIDLLIIDGIDEVDLDVKTKIIDEVENYCNEKNVSLIITTRKDTETKKQLHNFENYELLPFETSQAINYIKKILGKNQVLINSLLKGLEQLKHQIPLYPMSLSLLIEIAEKQHEVPASISELYKRYIEMTLSQESDGEKLNILFEPTIKKDFLESLSYEMFYQKNTTHITYEAFDRYVDEYMKKFPIISDKEAFMQELNRTTLIKIDEQDVEFLHKSFLDYFISSYFNNRQTELYKNNKFNEVYSLYHTNLWEDVTYFYFGQKTRILKDEIDLIINSTPEQHPKILKYVGKFMIGKLIQYAWYTESSNKQYAIKLAVEDIFFMKKELYKFIESDIGIELPKIVGDIQMLHYIDESFSSKFLVDEIKQIIQKLILEQNIDSKKIYFSTLYILENAMLLDKQLIENYFNFFIENYSKLDPEFSIPLTNIMIIFIKNKKICVDQSIAKNIENTNKKLKKKYEDLTYDYLSFKNKLSLYKVQQLRK